MADKTKLVSPQTQRQGTGIKTIAQVNFRGQMSDGPASEIGDSNVARAVNLISHGGYMSVRPGSKYLSVQATPPAGTLICQGWSKKHSLAVRLYGSIVYVSDSQFTYFEQVINITPTIAPGTSGMFQEWDGDMYLFAGGIFKIVLEKRSSGLNDLCYYMYKINCGLPRATLAGYYEDVTNIYGYWMIYSLSRIENVLAKTDGNITRLTENADLVWESGTCKNAGVEKDYCEKFTTAAIGPSHGLIVGPFFFPTSDIPRHSTHYSYYRSKNIGYNSGGRALVNGEGLGNIPEQMIWVEDIPVCKAVAFWLDSDQVTATIDTTFGYSHPGHVVAGDASQIFETISLTDGSSARIGYNGSIFECTTSSPTTGRHVGILGGDLAGGNSKVFVARQLGRVVHRRYGSTFSAADEGKTLYWANGRHTILVEYDILTGDMIAADDISSGGDMPCCLGPTSRYWNDTMPDDGSGAGTVGLNQRIERGVVMFQPKRFHDPLPACNCGVVESGYMVTVQRNESKVYYSGFSDRPACAGYYRPVDQEKDVATGVRDLRILDGVVVIICPNQMYIWPLNVAENAGLGDIGEYVPRLQEPIRKDPSIGVVAFGSIAYRGVGAFIALTNEPDIRMFTVNGWGKSLAEGQVQDLLMAIDHEALVVGTYCPQGGYKLRAQRWIEI